MKDISVVAWVPLIHHLNLLSEFPRGNLYQCALPQVVEQCIESLARLQPLIAFKSARLAKPSASVMSHLKQFESRFRFPESDYLRIDAEVPSSSIPLEASSELERRRYLPVAAAILVGEAIEDLLMCSELALPGLIDSDTGFATAGKGAFHQISSKSSFFTLRFGQARGSVWPAVEDLSLRDVVQWVTETSYLTHALPKTRIERTFAAFTHVVGLTQYRGGEVLFRAMQGLEAFYCDGIGDLRKQLADKASLWLGPSGSTKNLVGHLYDSRSKFIHGTVPFEYYNSHLDAYDERGNGPRSRADATDFSVRLLAATLQRCIKEHIHDLSWSYSVRTDA